MFSVCAPISSILTDLASIKDRCILVCKITYFLVHFQITEKTEVEDNTLRSSVIAILDFLNSIKELKLIEHETF